MTIIEEIKELVDVPTAARHYGVEVHRGNMALCPFHRERHPSCKLYADHYYCFGCQAHGDVIRLVQELFGLTPIEAVKQINSDDLIRSLESVRRGDALLDPLVTQRVFQEVRRAVKEEEASAFAILSQQEKHVLILVSEGKTNREIAKSLFLGEGTVRNYVSSILSKLGASNRAEAAAYAVEHNLKEYL